MLHMDLGVDDLAAKVGVDPKSVGRWLRAETLPHPRTRRTIARILQLHESFLWPETTEAGWPSEAACGVERIWPTRSSISSEQWHSFFSNCRSALDILVYDGGFLIETLDFAEVIAWKVDHGVTVRILIGHPECPAVRLRALEEGLPELPDRCRTMARYLKIAGVGPAQTRTHETTLYASHFRFDETILVNTHSYGDWACHSPVLQVCRLDDHGLFTQYRRSYDRVWSLGTALK
jgi:hypothetical protein